jgi:hypothetical protein
MKNLTNIRILGRGVIAILSLALFATMAMGQIGNLVLNGGTISNDGTLNIKGNINTSGAGGIDSILGIVNLDGAVQQLGVSGANALTFKTLNAIGTDNKVMNVNVTVTDALSVNNSAAKYLDVVDKILTLGGTSTLTSGSLDVSDVGNTVIYNGASAQTMLGLTYGGAVTLLSAGAKDLSGAASVAGAFSHTDGALTVNHNLTVSSATPAFATIADVTGTSTLELSGTGAKSISAISGITSGSAISNTGASGLLTVTSLNGNSGDINGGDAGITFENAAINGGNITGGAGPVTFSNTLAQSAGAITAGSGSVGFNGIPTVSGGSIIAGNGASLDFNTNIANSGTISLTGNGSAAFNGDFSSVGTLSFENGSQVTFDGAGQIIPAATYGNVTLAGSAAKTAAGPITVAGTALTLNNDLAMSASTLQITNPSTVVSGSKEVVGAVERNHTYAAATDYAFNRAEVTMNFASAIATATPITITMKPGVDPSGVSGTKYVKRQYGISSGVALASNNATMKLYYLNTELGSSANASKLGFYKYSGTTLSKLTSSSGGYSRNPVGADAATVALSAVNEGLGIISEIAMQNLGYFTIAGGSWAATGTWGSTLDDVPGTSDDATISSGNAVIVPITATIANLTIASTGSLAVSGADFNASTIDNSGAVTVAALHTLALTGTFTNQTAGSSIEITGIGTLMAVTNNGGFTVQNGGVANLSGAFINNLSLTTVGAGALTITGADLNNSGSISNAGTITVK